MNAPDLRPILDILERLRRRERLLVAARAVGWALVLLLGVWALAMGLAAWGLDRQTSRGSVLAVLALGGLAWVAVSGLAWRRAADLMRHALLLEADQPGLRGRLPALLDRSSGLLPGDAAGVVALGVRRATRTLADHQPGQIHSGWRALPPLASAGLACLFWTVLLFVAPMGPGEVARWLAGGAPEIVLPTSAEAQEGLPIALLGDLALEYHYPDYTGLPPLLVDNTNGQIHAPPGTRVRVTARTGERFDGAALQIDQDTPEPVELSEGRELSADVHVGLGDGTYRFLLQRGATAMVSPDFDIAVEPDTAPLVEFLPSAERFEVALDDPITGTWSARDDYGLSAVGARAGRSSVSLQPADPELEAHWTGALSTTARELGLEPGDEVSLYIVASDNDAVSGVKTGRSRPVRVRVLGEAADRRRAIRYRRELRDALVNVLAGFVTDPQPVAATRGELVDWSVRASRRFDPLDELRDAQGESFDLRTLEGRTMEEVERLGGSLVRFSLQLGEPGSAEPLDPRDEELLGEMGEELVARTETWILMLDRVVQFQALNELERQVQLLERDADSLALSSAAGAPANELLEWLDAGDQRVHDFQASAADFDHGRVRALSEQWGGDLLRLSLRIRQDLEAGDQAGAVVRSRWYAEEVGRLRASLLAMRGQLEEASEDEQEAIQKLIEELERIEAAELDLLARTTAAREKHGVGDEQLVDAWDEAARLSGLTLQRTQAAARQVGEGSSARMLERGSERAERLDRAVQARDLDNALREAVTVRQELDYQARELRFKAAMKGDTQSLSLARGEIEQAARAAMDLERLLSDLEVAANESSPALKRAIDGTSVEQDKLEHDTTATQQPAAELAASLPMGAPGLEENIEAAIQEMARAEGALARGWAVQAEGAEEAAADRIRQALEALAQAAQASSDLSEAMEGGQGEDQREPNDGEQQDALNDNPYLELPDAYTSDEAYRKALLEGMQAEVPETYEVLKRRYYEDLVRN
jgi:hypothetical protein